MIRATYIIKKISQCLTRGEITEDTRKRYTKLMVLLECAEMIESNGQLNVTTKAWLVKKANEYAYK